MLKEPQPPTCERLLLQATKTAKLLGISERHLWSLHTRGLVPEPLKLGRSVRWSQAELEEWIDAGGPSRETWKQNRSKTDE